MERSYDLPTVSVPLYHIRTQWEGALMRVRIRSLPDAESASPLIVDFKHHGTSMALVYELSTLRHFVKTV